MSDNEERQELELSSIKAIYPEVIDLRNERKIHQSFHQKKNNRQSVWRPLEIQISLKPNSDNVYVQADLYVKCSNKYPQEAPSDIQIKKAIGLSNVIVQQLEKKLVELSSELAEKDEESLFMCISKVEEFLNENNKPPNLLHQSFYDQMLFNQLKQREEEERLRLEKINKDKQNEEKLSEVLKQAMHEKQKLLENESRRLRRSSFMEDEFTLSINSLKLSISTIKERFLINLSSFKNSFSLRDQKSLRVCTQNHQLSQTDCKFKTISGSEIHVQKLSCDLHEDLYTDYLAIEKDSLKLYMLSEFQNLKLSATKEEKTRLMKELLSIKTKFEHKLVHLNHSNIIHPLAFTYTLENDLVSLRLLQNHVHNIRFCDLPFVLNNFEQQEIRSSFYLIQILDALNYLHSNQIIHGNLNTENVILNLEIGQIKLINPLIQTYLFDFIEQLNCPTKSFNTQSVEHDYNRDYVSFGLLICWFKLKLKLNFKELILMKQSDLIRMLHEHRCSCSELELVKNCFNRNSVTVLEPILIDYFEQACEIFSENLKKTSRLIDEIENDQMNINNNLNELVISNKNSRLSDFEILSKIGQGGFGEVYKVRNNLDQNLYALKKIKINTTNKLLNKKIKQEVRYLSGLCHENVVRYYSSWIEYEFANKKDEIDCNSNKSDKEYFTQESTDEDEETEDLIDARSLFSNSLLHLPKVSNKNEDFSDSYVIFQDSQDGDKKNSESDLEDTRQLRGVNQKKFNSNVSPFNEIMYIQMELCERSTLDHAINSQQLFLDSRRSRRLFRELIEALAYIHEKYIIHRDLKPGNIFLDSYDHVKIGDFGLATGYVNELLRAEQVTNQEVLAISRSSDQNSNLTNQSSAFNPKSEIVGTPFYVSPEIQAKSQDYSTKKITYTQKVDIYSAGIIFFEMCYKPPKTGMERFKILTNLRLPEIIFPSDVQKYLNDGEQNLIRQLLNHNPNERPTSSELLESEHLPPLEIEEAKQQVMIRQVIQNPRSKQHKFLLNALFNRQMSSVEEIVYDSEIDVVKSKKQINNEQLKARVFQFVTDRLKIILKKYGAIQFTVPTFTPVNSLSKFNLNQAFSICDNNGSIIQPPYDLRIPFSRFLARNLNLNDIPIFKRYAIDKVYRSQIVGHPKELYEFAYDIVTIQTGINWPILPDVEVLLVLNEIIDSFEGIKNKPFTLRVNSVKFLKAVFAYFEIDEQNFDEVLRIIAESNDRNFVSRSNDSEYSKTPKDHITYMLSSKNILELNKINVVLQMLFENEKNTAKEMSELVQFYMRRRSQPKQKQAYHQAIDAIKELGLIIDCLQNSCNTFRMKIKFVPNLVLNLSNCNIYSRLIFQLQYDVVKKHQILHSILATGGRYDGLIESFQVNFSTKQDQMNEKALIFADQRTAVGFSVEVEKIVKCVIEDDEQLDMEECSDCDLVLYAETYEDERYRFIFKDLCQIAHELSSVGYRVKVFNENLVKSLSDLNKFCSDNLIKFLFILIKSNDQQKNLYQLKARVFEKEKFSDRRSNNLMNCFEIIEYIKTEMLTLNSNNYSSSPFSAFNINQLNNNFTFESSSCLISSNYMSSNNNFTANINTSNIKYQSPDLSTTIISKTAAATNIQFIEVEKTFESLSKKKVLALVSSSISNKLNNFVNNSIEVLVLEIPFKILKFVVYESEFEKDGFGNFVDNVEQSIKRMIDVFPKYRTQIKELMYEILELKRGRKHLLIVLCSVYNLHDFKYIIVP